MGSFAAGESLIAPTDIALFAFAYLVLVLLPGYAMAALARPRSPHSERLAFAIPCACSLVTISGLGTALLLLSFGLPAYATLAVPITIAAGYTQWRRRGELSDTTVGRWWRWWLVPV